MRPKIFRKDGCWHCRDEALCDAVGATPKLAYEQWLSMSDFVRRMRENHLYNPRLQLTTPQWMPYYHWPNQVMCQSH